MADASSLWNSIMVIIEFTPWDKLTDKDEDNSNFSSKFIHGSKDFILSLLLAPGERVKKYDKQFTESNCAGKSLATTSTRWIPFPSKKKILVKKFNIPSFDYTSWSMLFSYSFQLNWPLLPFPPLILATELLVVPLLLLTTSVEFTLKANIGFSRWFGKQKNKNHLSSHTLLPLPLSLVLACP
ncbi:hypothetical protein VP01_7288g1 [Puccinia sorghi]|uniref:Uncharacterized protein n=1 Tax=Puccinia sorghi TaxID=27349 RepID=A0A0L6UD27_9BASI|nr:hypothetical protein VP01_7288g1 [Puccinia sorghi]